MIAFLAVVGLLVLMVLGGAFGCFVVSLMLDRGPDLPAGVPASWSAP